MLKRASFKIFAQGRPINRHASKAGRVQAQSKSIRNRLLKTIYICVRRSVKIYRFHLC